MKDIFQALNDLSEAQAAAADFDEAISDEIFNRSQAAHAAYMRALFPNLEEKYLRFVLWSRPTIQGVCL